MTQFFTHDPLGLVLQGLVCRGQLTTPASLQTKDGCVLNQSSLSKTPISVSPVSAVSPVEQAFLNDIASAPFKDDSRLIYADWLEDQGNPVAQDRAELIRIQTELDGFKQRNTLDAQAGSANHSDIFQYKNNLCNREYELLRRVSTWLGRPATEVIDGLSFEKGLLESVWLSAAKYLELAPRLHGLGSVRRAYLTEVMQVWERLVQCPWLKQIQTLDLRSNNLGSRALQLLTAQSLPQLGRLVLKDNPLGPMGINELASAQDWPRLSSLDLEATQLGANGVEVLARAHSLAKLTWLDLSENNIGLVGVQLLAQSKHVKNLEILSLQRNQLPAEACAILGGMGIGTGRPGRASSATSGDAPFPRLRQLELNQNPLGDEGLSYLAHSPHWTCLNHLEVASSRIGPVGIAALSRSSMVTGLWELNLAGNLLGSEGAAALAQAKFRCLRRLDLSGNEIGDEGARALGRSPHLSQVSILKLSNNGLRVAGLRSLLVGWPKEPIPSLGQSVTRLELSGNRLEDDGLRLLARWPGLRQLKQLELKYNQISDQGVIELSNSQYLGSLCRINLTANDFSKENKEVRNALEKLRERCDAVEA